MKKRRDQLNVEHDVLPPRIRKKLEEQKGFVGKWECVNSNDKEFVVDLDKRDCICRLWALSEIPCCHAIAAIYYMEEEPDTYVSHFLTNEYARKAYRYSIPYCNGEKIWDGIGMEAIFSPLSIGECLEDLKKARRKEFHERESTSEISRKGREMHCTNCKAA
ncbi:hypothetical protein FRX31_008427 [Thalictrum thalictroides]|uniref:SWIM-type domain-containing protein n=1 Tax=Thalictrum thalictroides TaxID=46969 RepID=A0A7J6WY30_THATH|nr:hypothetical protein FRX31_008427 [Thalictrum thalictroides]